jgi:hypothetical protein
LNLCFFSPPSCTPFRPEKKQAGGLGGFTEKSVDFRVLSLAGPAGPTHPLKTLPSLSNNYRPPPFCSSPVSSSYPRPPPPSLPCSFIFSSPFLSATSASPPGIRVRLLPEEEGTGVTVSRPLTPALFMLSVLSLCVSSLACSCPRFLLRRRVILHVLVQLRT